MYTVLASVQCAMHNICCRLPNEMGHMPHLKSLHLDGNPLKTLRRDIVQVGELEAGI